MSRVVVTGGAGFLGSHLCERLIARGDEVVCIDDFSTAPRSNVQGLVGASGLTLIENDVVQGFPVVGHVDAIVHLASPASPRDYLARPLETLAVGSEGTRHCLELAAANSARFVLASTSEVYGEPLIHPQREDYWGNVNPVGPRSVYDEAKRFAEALTMAWHRLGRANVGIARIFNTYGPRLRPGDGRVVSNFIVQALTGRDVTVYGDGRQTRSLCYVEDEVTGLLALLDSGIVGPINIGNPEEHSVLELAETILRLCGSSSRVTHGPLPADDPSRRRPDISRAMAVLGWTPRVSLIDGLSRTIEWMKAEILQ